MNKFLDKNTERKLIALGHKRFYRVLALTVAWISFVIAVFILFVINEERSFADLHNYIILLLCILPFFPFSAHKTLFSKTFYATVSYTVNETQFDTLRQAYVSNRPEVVNVLEVTYEKDNGKKFALTYKKDKYLVEGLHYDEGDRVFFVRGLKYPLKFPITEGKEFTCPVCGHTVSAEDTVCKSCRLDFTDILKV
jgi:hypothetical protein